MGRRTYEVGLREGVTSPYPTLDQYVFSRTMRRSPAPDVKVVAGDPVGAVTALKREPGKAIWLCGGGTLASQLLRGGLIDGVIVKLNPVLFGAGIPLFARPHPPVRLRLTGSKAYDSGHVVLHYVLE